MQPKQQMYFDHLRAEGFLPEELGGDVRFKVRGETYILHTEEADPNYFKLSYYHAWDPAHSAEVLPLLNSLNAKLKVVKVLVGEKVICLTTESLLKDPEDFKPMFGRFLSHIEAGKHHLGTALAEFEQRKRAAATN